MIESAAADKNTLIAMATHGRSGLNRWLLGSVAEKVVRGSSNPVLLVRATESVDSEGEATLKRVIVPLDGSELAESVLPTVADVVKRLKLEMILVRAFNVPPSLYAGSSTERRSYEEIEKDLKGLQKQFKTEAHDYLQKKAEELKSAGLNDVTVVSPEGNSADQIITLAQETPDSFVAMCTHGRSGVRRWVLGSVTENVVRHSDKPVLVIRAQ
jgi:nucleotide-binding universal stress UspA family protein